MSKARHAWRDRKHPTFYGVPESTEDIRTLGRSLDAFKTSTDAGLSEGLTTKPVENTTILLDTAHTACTIITGEINKASGRNTKLLSKRTIYGLTRTSTFDPGESILPQQNSCSSENLLLNCDIASFGVQATSPIYSSIQFKNTTDGVSKSNKRKRGRPFLRRAISEVGCRGRVVKDPDICKEENPKSKQTKACLSRRPAHLIRLSNSTFDSSILEMPIEISTNFAGDKASQKCADTQPTDRGLICEDKVQDFGQTKLYTQSGSTQSKSHFEFPRPKKCTRNFIKRMHSTAVDSHSDRLSRYRRNQFSEQSPNMDLSKTVTFNEAGSLESTRALFHHTSFDCIAYKHEQKLGQSNCQSFERQLSAHSVHTFPSNVVSKNDKSTSTSAYINHNATALADGNMFEQGSEYAKQSTSSYLKEQFLAFFQPSDNKLAMKLFGSKNALLKEKRRQEQQGKWVIHPCSNFRFYWDLLMLVLLIANLIILPVAISFFNDDLSIHWIVFNTISDVIFIADIAVKFRTGIVANDYADEIVLNPKEIARQYLRTWFVLDFISSIPMDYLYLIFNKKDHYNQFLSAGRTLRILRLAKLLSMLRLLRLTRLVRYVSQWEEFLNIASKFMGIFNLVLLMLLLGHWNACLQYLIPMLMDFPPDSWVKRCKLENADWFQQYTWALFKAMSHMLSIGYGRFPPISIGDAWITIVSMMSGATCYALFVGHAAALIQSFDTSKRLYREKFKQVEEYMAYRKLPRALRQRIANYYEHRYQGKMFDEAQILNEFSECLREQVINYNCRALVAAVPFFTYADQDFVSEVVTKLKFEVFQPGDLIIKEGTIGNKMYFIQEGIVDIITKDGDVATSLSDGSYFGEICLLTNARRVASVKSVVYSNLYSLDRESFLSVLECYPLMRRTMESVAAERLSKIGQNPAIVSDREDLKEDLSLVKEIVSSAVTPEDSTTDTVSDIEETQSHLNLRQLLKRAKNKRHSCRQQSSPGSRRESQIQGSPESGKSKHLLSSVSIMSRIFKSHKRKTAQVYDSVCDEQQNQMHTAVSNPDIVVELAENDTNEASGKDRQVVCIKPKSQESEQTTFPSLNSLSTQSGEST